MRIETPKSVHGCFDVFHNNGITYVITSKSNPLHVENSVAVTRATAKVIVYKVAGYEVRINGTWVVPNQYEIADCALAFTTLESSSARFAYHWCAYHSAIGAGFFLLYDNNSSDEEFNALVDATRSFPGIIFRWNYPYVTELGFTAQASQQTHALCVSRHHIRRIGLTDLDEYLVVNTGTLDELLTPPLVRVQWKWVGQAGKQTTDPRDYTRSARHLEPGHYSKLICDPLCVEIATIHQCWGPSVAETGTTNACLHHYRALSNDRARVCTMADHAHCRFCEVENTDLLRAFVSN